MKKNLFTILIALTGFAALAQNYSVDWYKIAGGGGTSGGGNFSVSGTIGQPDATAINAMSGGNFSLTGGFWSIYALQTPGAPQLLISRSSNTVTVYWQNIPGWNLQSNNNLATPASWAYNAGAILNGSTNYLMLTNPPGNQFYRLSNP